MQVNLILSRRQIKSIAKSVSINQASLYMVKSKHYQVNTEIKE